MAKNVEWVKITTDMFDNKKIKHLRKLPDGNSIVLIWVMLLTMAGRCNAGGMIFLTENIPYTPKMLSDELGFELSTIQLALEALERLNMISRNEDMLFISGWEEHQNIDALERIRESNRDRKRVQRERERFLLESQSVTSRDSHVTVTDDVTQCHAAEEEGEEDIEIDNNSQKENKQKKKFSYDDGDAPPDVSPASGTDARPKKEEKIFDAESDAYKAAAYLARQMEKNYPNMKPPTEKDKQHWAADFDKCNRIDGYDWWDISDVLHFSQQSAFWRKNILSGRKFREKYERLLIEMTEENRKNGK